MNLPLEGLKVLDLSQYLPGPFCTQLLADFGAEVIKVEDPRGGELGRLLTPVINDQSARFYTVNRNKKSITIDLKKEEGKAIFKKLVLQSDIVVDQFRPGAMDKMGLGYDNLKEINDKIIYCAITGYGLTGPLRDTTGHGLNLMSLSGITELTGMLHGMPALTTVQTGGTLYAVIAILMALISREKTGKGQLCDIAMMDGSISLLAYTLGEWSGLGYLPERGDELLTGGYACYNIYKTKDNKYISLGAVEERFWAEFCRKLGREDFIAVQWDKSKQDLIMNDIKVLMAEKNRDEWIDFFRESNVCLTPVLNLEEMCDNSQVKARDMIYKLQNVRGSGREVIIPGIPIKLSETPGKAVLRFPELGEHNEEVLLSAGYSAEEIEEFHNKHII